MSQARHSLEIAEAKSLFEYRDGLLYWKVRAANRIQIGSIAGTTNKRGYRVVGIRGTNYFAHRIIWALSTNEWPPDHMQIDHIDGNPKNNWITNLRLVDASDNHKNKKQHRAGQPIGVSFMKGKDLWSAKAPRKFLNWRAPKTTYIGVYRTMEDAAKAVVSFCSKEHNPSSIAEDFLKYQLERSIARTLRVHGTYLIDESIMTLSLGLFIKSFDFGKIQLLPNRRTIIKKALSKEMAKTLVESILKMGDS